MSTMTLPEEMIATVEIFGGVKKSQLNELDQLPVPEPCQIAIALSPYSCRVINTW